MTLCTGENIYEVAGKASGMGLDGMGEVGAMCSEGCFAGVYGADFADG